MRSHISRSWMSLLAASTLLVAASIAPSRALAQANESKGQAQGPWIDQREILVTADQIQRVFITSLGRSETVPPIGPRGCAETRTYTDAAFEGGSYIAEAGFVQGETAAASYTIPAAHFPIQVVSLEMVFVQSQALVTTTTQWGVRAWAGDPRTGTQVAAYDSDDLILPHIVMPPGTQGTNVYFTIDPNDPEQIIINDNGTHTFSVGYIVNQMNLPPSNLCTQSPDARRNAFPVVDTSGLAASTNNWLGALNCGSGPLQCVPGGGFKRFSEIQVLCRPTGDWVLRVVYRPLDCQPGVGACCIDGVCSVTTATNCTSQGGSYLGDGSTCAGVNCPVPNQACCFASTGGCLNLNPTTCTNAGGVPGGPGSVCGTFVCFPMGACCLPNGSCQSPLSPEACAALGGVFEGNGTTCANVTCPQPTGACCFGNGFCLALVQGDCTTAGGSWAGPGTTCADSNSNGRADACETACPGDLNNDFAVNLQDLATMLSHFGVPSGATHAQGDLDGDGDVDLADLATLLANFGRTC